MGGVNPVRLHVQGLLKGAHGRRNIAVKIVCHAHVGLRFDQRGIDSQGLGIGFDSSLPVAPAHGVAAAPQVLLDGGVRVRRQTGRRKRLGRNRWTAQPGQDESGEQQVYAHQPCCGAWHSAHHTQQARESKAGACSAWPAVIVFEGRLVPMPPVEAATSPLTLLLSLGMLVLGLGILVPLVLVLLAAFQTVLGGVLERAAFRRSGLRCGRGDALIEQGDFAGAVRLFGEAFFLRPVRRDAELLSDIANYHSGLLSRLLTIADEMGKSVIHLPSLAVVDRLLAERLEIQLDYFRARKRRDAERLRDSQERLTKNQQLTRAAIDRLLNEIRSSSEEGVLYH